MNKKALKLLTGMALTMCAAVTHAASYQVELEKIYLQTDRGAPLPVFGNTTFTYDEGVSIQAQGEFFAVAALGTSLFDHQINGLLLTLGSNPAEATGFSCNEGLFGDLVGANLCGNYNYGGDFIEQSSITYGTDINGDPDWTRTMLGDDGALGPAQSLADYDNMRFVSLGSTYYGPLPNTLDLDPNKMWLHVTNRAIDTGANDPGNTGIDMYFSYTVVPVPAAVWLFASGLGLLGWMKRKPV